MDEVNKILERLMARPTYVDDIRKLAMSVYLWMRQKPLVAILIVALFILTVSIGNSLVLIVIFFATILYANNLIRRIRMMTSEIVQNVSNIFDGNTLAILGVIFGALIAVIVAPLVLRGDVIPAIVLDPDRTRTPRARSQDHSTSAQSSRDTPVSPRRPRTRPSDTSA